MSAAQNGAKPYYFVPQPSHWPITGACALLLMGTGAAFWFNGRKQSGPACAPVSTNLPGGSVSMAA